MEDHPSQNLVQPEDFDVEEIEAPTTEEGVIVDGGEVDSWKPFIPPQRVSLQRNVTRSFFAYMVIAVWVLWNVVAICRSVTVGDNVLLFCEPALVLLPLKKVLCYYFDE